MTGCLSTSQTASAVLCGVGQIICRLFAFFVTLAHLVLVGPFLPANNVGALDTPFSSPKREEKPSLLRSTLKIINFDVAISSSNPRRRLKFSVDTDVGNFPSDSGSHHEWRC